MREAKGGTFSTPDINFLLKVLAEYEPKNREEQIKVGNLVHRMYRILPSSNGKALP